ncbi:putative MO25-like protein At5g47540 [Curcuma longa]|uniref:putative MO25-like protein At5g47540 n=1 Tax=Curcuma longa TaxID=136217 RepID=UPI003D9E92D6
MKGLFKSKPRTPADIVRHTRELLIYIDLNANSRDPKREEKMSELCKNIRELKFVLYGDSASEPVVEACTQLTQQFFRQNTLRLLIICLPKLNLEAKKDATQVVANLQRQQVQSRLIASDYLEANKDLLDILIFGYEDMDIALHYGAMLRECIRHQSVARFFLVFNVKEFCHTFDNISVAAIIDFYITVQDYDIDSINSRAISRPNSIGPPFSYPAASAWSFLAFASRTSGASLCLNLPCQRRIRLSPVTFRQFDA